jgi:hypothetical protein
MTGARLPKMKKSYHSKAVPADDAMTMRAIDRGFCCSAMDPSRSPEDYTAVTAAQYRFTDMH